MNPQAITGRINRITQLAVVAAVLGIALCLFGIISNRTQFLHSYLFGYVFWISLTVGCFGFTLMHHIVRGSWGRPVIRLFEAGGGAASFGLMALLFVPILLGFSSLYPWADPAKVAASPVLTHRAGWMNPSFVGIRTFVFYFGVWGAIALVLRSLSLRQDKTGDASLAQWRTNIASLSAVYFFLSATSAFTDWVMSLDSNWFSTMYGAWFIVGAGLLTLAFTITLTSRWVNLSPYAEAFNEGVWKDLGNLTLTFTMFWAYTSISQFLIIWSANLPEEISYYYVRNTGMYLPLGALLIVGQFFIPFLALLSGKTKRDSGWRLKTLAGWILLMRFLDIFWIVVPALQPNGFNLTPMDYLGFIGSFLGVGGLWLLVFATQLKSATLVPDVQPVVQGALDHA